MPARRAARVSMRTHLPRTTGVKGVGSCGHEFTVRVGLPLRLARQERTPERVRRFEEFRASAVRECAAGPCPACVAAENLSECRARVAGVCEVLGVEVLRPLPEGSVRMLSYAEGVRAEMFLRRLMVLTREVSFRFKQPSLLDVLFEHAVREVWPWPGRDAGLDLGRLSAQMHEQGLSWYPAGSEECSLAVWLVLRAEARAMVEAFNGATSPRFWVGVHRSPAARCGLMPAALGGEAGPLGVAVLAACTVARMGGWADREEALVAFRALSERPVDGVGAFLADRAGVALPAVLEQVASFSALLSDPWDRAVFKPV